MKWLEAVRNDNRPPVRVALMLLVDLLLPLAAYVAVAIAYSGRLFWRRNDVFIGLGKVLSPSDFNGTVWFYWWLERSIATGRPLLWPDTVCAPTGQGLGGNFPNRIDAYLALPFFHFFPFPANYNLFVLAVLVVGALAAYLGLRATTSWRLAAWAGGLLYGFNGYSMLEIRQGRPVTGLIFTLPLFLAAWLCCLNARDWKRCAGWALVSGALGALTVAAYLPYAIWLLALAVLLGLGKALWPAPRASRLRPLGAAVLTATLGLALSGPYVHEVLVLRPAGEGRRSPPELLEPLPPWSGELWKQLEVQVPLKAGAGGGVTGRRLTWTSPRIQQAEAQSMSVDWPWGFQPGQIQPRVWLAPALMIAGLVLGLLAGRRGLGWLAATAFFYTLTLGPYASWQKFKLIDPVMLGGTYWKMPLYWLLEKVPYTQEFMRPYRAFPMVLLCLIMAVVASIDTLAPRTGPLLRRLTRRFRPDSPAAGPPRAEYGAHLAVGAVVILLLLSAAHVRDAGGLRLPLSWWTSIPFHQTLAKQGGDAGVVELPMGLGHGLALFQLIHGQPRTEGHHDALQYVRAGQPPPYGCYQLPFLEGLWALEYQGGADAEAAVAGLTPASIQEAREAGLRYVLVYPEAFRYLAGERLPLNQAEILQVLEAHLGAPVYKDARLIAFEIPTTGTVPGGSATGTPQGGGATEPAATGEARPALTPP